MVENDFIAGLNSSESLWLGGSEPVQEFSWVWTDDSPFTFTNWGPGQPNIREQNCFLINFPSSGYWDDEYCSEKRKFVCKIGTGDSCNYDIEIRLNCSEVKTH